MVNTTAPVRSAERENDRPLGLGAAAAGAAAGGVANAVAAGDAAGGAAGGTAGADGTMAKIRTYPIQHRSTQITHDDDGKMGRLELKDLSLDCGSAPMHSPCRDCWE